MEDQNIVTVQITTSAIIAYVIEQLKHSPWFPWLNEKSEKVNRSVAVIAALAAAVGIHAKFDSTTGTLMITGLTVASVAHMAFDWTRSYVFQELIYRGVLKSTHASRTLPGPPPESARAAAVGQ